jgi:hypothetical protein
MASFTQASPPTPCARLYPPSYAPLALPISFVSILPPAQYWLRIYWSCMGKILDTRHPWQKGMPAQFIRNVADVDIWNCDYGRQVITRDVDRELYYQNVGLVGSQRLLDSAVRDICSLLKVPAWNLGVTTTSKGLIAGPVSLVMEGGDVIDCMAPGGESCCTSESVQLLASAWENPNFCNVSRKSLAVVMILHWICSVNGNVRHFYRLWSHKGLKDVCLFAYCMI